MLYRAALAGRRTEMEQRSPDGDRCFLVFGKPMVDDGGEVWAGLVLAQDITALRATERTLRTQADRLSELAERDELTRLPNRALLNDRLEHAMARAERDGMLLALLFIDLDRFKNVNDSLGHEAGDEVLRAVAERLQSATRKAETIARFGGDEFVMLVEGVAEPADVLTVINRIAAAIRAPLTVGGSELVITASLGVALAPHDGATPSALLAAADRAMYRAKTDGDRHRFFDATMNERALERLGVEAALHHALRRDEFVLHYQPAIDWRRSRWCPWKRSSGGTTPSAGFWPRWSSSRSPSSQVRCR